MTKDVKVTASLQAKKGKYYVVLNWRENGVRKQKWVATGLADKGNKRKAEAMMADIVMAHKQDLQKVRCDMLFADYLDYWLTTTKASLAPNTYEIYKLTVQNQIAPYFRAKGIVLCDLRPCDIQDYHTHRMEHDGVSANTVHHHQAHIHTALKYAVNNDLIPSNPADRVRLPKKEKYEADYYRPEDIAKLLPCVKDTWLEAPVYITCFYGFRRSEVLGLTWDAIDYANNTISVRQKVYGAHDSEGKAITVISSELKTKSSRRTLPLVPAVRDYLLRLQERQTANKALLGNAYNYDYDKYICVTEKGDLIKPAYVTRAFGDLLERYGLKKIRFHDLRHSCASMLLSQGVSLKLVQGWLGHADFSTTANIYAHLSFDDKIGAGQVMANLLAPPKTTVRNRLERTADI